MANSNMFGGPGGLPHGVVLRSTAKVDLSESLPTVNSKIFDDLKKDVSKESLMNIVNRNFPEHLKSVIGLLIDSKRIDVEYNGDKKNQIERMNLKLFKNSNKKFL